MSNWFYYRLNPVDSDPSHRVVRVASTTKPHLTKANTSSFLIQNLVSGAWVTPCFCEIYSTQIKRKLDKGEWIYIGREAQGDE